MHDNSQPVHDEIDNANLAVTGHIPLELNGVYMRNGPNPLYGPEPCVYPFDGDGMIHAVYLHKGQAYYKNRFVATDGLLAEKRAGQAIYSSVTQPKPVDPQLLETGDDPGPTKNGSFIHVIRHAQTYLSLHESRPAYEITRDLQTLGKWQPLGSDNPIDLCPHTRYDPKTGDLYAIDYDLLPPYLTVYRFNAQGEMTKQVPIHKSDASMIHDFVLTENYIVIIDCPMIFDMERYQQGGPFLDWQPERGVRVAVMPKNHMDPHQVTWYDCEPFFAFHYVNGFEYQNNIIVEYIHRGAGFTLGTSAIQNVNKKPTLYRMTINLHNGGSCHNEALDDTTVEFPQINPVYNSLRHRYSYMPAKTHSEHGYNTLLQYDRNTATFNSHDFGPNTFLDEAVFAPRANARDEKDGYVMLFVYQTQTNTSEFVILDGNHIDHEPIARIHMPRRVPHGLHGSWLPDE